MSEVIREAVVVNNNDPDKLGKIQIRVLPEMLDFKTEWLPWVGIYNQGTGSSTTSGTHELPEVDSLIRVIIEDWPYLRRIRCISNDYVEGLYIYSKASGLSAITELGTQTYPQPVFQIYKDGCITFHNSTTGEHGTFYKNGGYQLVDADGNFYMNTKASKIKLYNTAATLKEILKSFQEILLNLATPLNFVDGEGKPCTYAKAGVDLPKAQQALIKLNNLMED